MTGDIEGRVNGIFQDVFSETNLTVGRQTTAADVEGWDSLTHINLIVAVEKEFRIRFTTAEVMRLKNVGELIDAILRKKS